ncbi:hypothetical protein B0H13DRAFT_2365381 [Mycena leptocephala]|nr:hypothetical protein B0H13DRAFT_2365381 [Mycena leptocephala]
MSSLIPMDDRLPLRCCIPSPAYFSSAPFTETPTFVYYVFSSIGLATAEASSLLRKNFRTRYPHMPGCGRYEQSKEFLDDQRFLQAGLATIYAVTGFHERLSDEAILAAHADLDAVLEFMRDDFVESWGPRFSRKAAARRAKALAREAREVARDAQRAAEEAEASGVLLGQATWGNGGGWGPTATGWGGEPSAWWTGGDWDGSGGNGWLLGNDNPRQRKPPRRFSHPWPPLRLVCQAPTFFKTFERLHQAHTCVFCRLSAELHRTEHIRLQEECHELRRLRRLAARIL